MDKLKNIRKQKADAFIALQECSDNLKPQLQQVYDDLDNKETQLMEELDIDVD